MPASASAVRFAEACTANMPPLVDAAAVLMAFARSQAIVSAVGASNTPALCKAITSPKLCPACISARTPSCLSSASCDNATAAIAGCAFCIAVNFAVAAEAASSVNIVGGNARSCNFKSAVAGRSHAESHTALACPKAIAISAPMPTY